MKHTVAIFLMWLVLHHGPRSSRLSSCQLMLVSVPQDLILFFFCLISLVYSKKFVYFPLIGICSNSIFFIYFSTRITLFWRRFSISDEWDKPLLQCPCNIVYWFKIEKQKWFRLLIIVLKTFEPECNPSNVIPGLFSGVMCTR